MEGTGEDIVELAEEESDRIKLMEALHYTTSRRGSYSHGEKGTVTRCCRELYK